ncbi:alpha/beta fold hydrolase [Aspergillus candidus]|uniref:Alpha/beta-hydrolase n=1 Tax=Aspergillus candidus TaxID=41067 RepID=A0A2I2FNM8_ASPCN|nr:alpha/beta-hydrolase [Aspergillus candidus]PLB42229.1 alpha/beta-hydrolase [Aspergillus candidus]
MPLSAVDIINHSAYDSVDWKLPPTTSGTTPVAQNRRGGPFNLYYETHGSGPIKMVWIMGLNAVGKDWKRQTKYFGHTHGDKYTSLVFDNRGVGRTDKPTTYYSTSEMAQDVVDLLHTLNWIDTSSSTPARSIHVVGASMGGMIAQELATLIPSHIGSLTLCCTAPRLVRTVPFMEYLRERAAMFIPKHIDVELERVSHTLFGEEFLSRPDTENEDPKLNFPTNRDRYAAGQLRKRADPVAFTTKGFLMQVVACYFHSKSAAQLKAMGDAVGRGRIAVVHGTEDRMLTFRHGEMLREALGEEITWVVYEGSGHMLPWEREREFNLLVEEMVDREESRE